ncbi:S-formylglutathione hydrolase FrmB [Catalinimonas alkaloidigena]|uniref:alpha/beta hydrolase n=1 Tax=Catalinimonas alkaloidigena TaxID=1075417 RepID=UPI002406DBDD|nr:alpha/beta hydrolase family protein [Catalinimonas alkaloidigena]MDF9800480.1 S-formylglutathione hydrolase FrmB [Catalinimonas alkaloidigena]
MKIFQFFIIVLMLMLGTICLGASVDTLEVDSKRMQRKIKTAVVVPDSYDQVNRAYPVLYLLHGGTGSYRDWHHKTPDKKLLHRMADQYNIIIVTPDGGATSYYFDSPLDQVSQYETFISQEVVEKIDSTYRTVKDRKGRAIAGLSMGGHGAFFIAARHPRLYCAAGSMSGVMNINTATWKVPEEFAQLRAKNFAKLLGPAEASDLPYSNYTVVGMIDQMKDNDVKLKFDCGVDDFLIDTNRDLHQKLLTEQVPHEYTERPGSHSWEYWQNALPYHILFAHEIFKENGVAIP